MSAALRNVGEYRGEIFDYALIEKKNDKGEFNGLSLAIKVKASEVWMTPEGSREPAWLDCSEWDTHGEGYLVLISKAGKVNDSQIQRLVKFAGWDGDFQSLSDHTWEPKPIRFDVAEDNYNGLVNYRINWINDYESVPGGGGNVDADRAKALNSAYGPAIRAIASNARGQKPAPAAGKPASPRKPTRQQTPVAPVAPAADAGEIPF